MSDPQKQTQQPPKRGNGGSYVIEGDAPEVVAAEPATDPAPEKPAAAKTNKPKE